ncbi:MAG TPA: hypothetical protein VIS95_10165 [Solirubrobacterales bacterium]
MPQSVPQSAVVLAGDSLIPVALIADCGDPMHKHPVARSPSTNDYWHNIARTRGETGRGTHYQLITLLDELLWSDPKRIEELREQWFFVGAGVRLFGASDVVKHFKTPWP